MSPEYGFRVDPMSFVENDTSFDAALVRTLVFRRPTESDKQAIAETLAQLNVFERRDSEGAADTSRLPYSVDSENLLRLARLGATPEHPEVRQALELLDKLPRKPRRPIGGDALHALCLLDRADHPAVHHSLRLQIETADEWIYPLSGCPWTPTGALPGLWAARELENTAPLVERALGEVYARMDDTGCLGFMDPWSFVDCAAHIDLPIARKILRKQIPMLLRAQKADGGWGESTFKVFAALEMQGLLQEFRAKPPLPPDWDVVRSIPTPNGSPLFGLVWDGTWLWTGIRASNEAIALAPDDGRVLRRVQLPAGSSRWLGWWDGELAVTQGGADQNDSKRLVQVDPDDGRLLKRVSLDKLEWVGGVVQVGRELWLLDSFFGSRYVLDAAKPRSPRESHDEGDQPCALPIAVNAAGDDALWFVDAWSPWIVKTDQRGNLLDWSERPFDGYQGVAWDGQQLWAIDTARNCLSAVEKSATAPHQ